MTVDGKPWESTCFIDWDVLRGATVELELTENPNVSCGGTLPASLSTGEF